MVLALSLDVPRTVFIENFLYIDNKQGTVVPFKFNRVQTYFNAHKSHRNIVLKARQLGMTSSILADMYMDCIMTMHASCAVVSHETRATQRLLDRVQFYHDTLSEPKPKIGAESRSEKTFPGLHSSIYIGTAGSRAFGRGDTIRKVLLSEAAFYDNADILISGVEDAVPNTGELTLESTANGENNAFFDKWVLAKEGRSPYKPFFFPWWWGEDYSIPRYSELAMPEDQGELAYTEEEGELVERMNLTEDQIRWRRWKFAEKQERFYIEFPENEIDCFITTGAPVFDTDILSMLSNNAYDGKPHSEGWVFWLPPEEGMRYVIGADSSAGVPKGSFSAAVVLNDRYEVCATYFARVEPTVFANMLKKLGGWYNNAEIAVERNFTGYAVLSQMTDYGNIYYQRDFVTGKITSQRGWWTNNQTKEHMRTVLKDKLPDLKIWDVNVLRQLRGYRYIKLLPVAQTFDDLVIALMIAVVVRKASGTARGYQGSVPGWGW